MDSLPVRKHLPHDPPRWVREGEIFFITMSAANREARPFAQTESATALLAAARHYHSIQKWWLRLFLVMPDHIHALLAFPPEHPMRKTLATWKSYTAKITGVRWQRDFFDHRPRNTRALEEKEIYIVNNPVRWNLVSNSEDWPWVLRQKDLPPWSDDVLGSGASGGRALP